MSVEHTQTGQSVKIEYQVTAADIAWWRVLGRRFNGGQTVQSWAGVVIFSCLGATLEAISKYGPDPALCFLLCVIVLVPVCIIVAYRRSGSAARDAKLYPASQTTFTADEVTISSELGSATLNWKAYEYFLFDHRLLGLIRQGNATVNVFPRRAFDSDGWALVEG